MICKKKNKWPTFFKMSRPREALQTAGSQGPSAYARVTGSLFQHGMRLESSSSQPVGTLRLSRHIEDQMTSNTGHSFCVYGAQNSKTIFRSPVPTGSRVCLVRRLTGSPKDGRRKGYGAAIQPGSLTAPALPPRPRCCQHDLTCVRTLR